MPIREIPKKWLKERRPDLYKALFEKKDAHVTPQIKATVDKLTRKGLSDGLIKYLDKHPEVNAVFFQLALEQMEFFGYLSIKRFNRNIRMRCLEKIISNRLGVGDKYFWLNH